MSTISIMWRGTCHSVPADDVRMLQAAGLVRRSPVGGYEGVPAAMGEHRTPSDATSWLRQRSGGAGPSAGASRTNGFWNGSAGQQRTSARGSRVERGRARRTRFAV